MRASIETLLERGVGMHATRWSQPSWLLCAAPCLGLQADQMLRLYNGEWNHSVDPIYSPEYTY